MKIKFLDLLHDIPPEHGVPLSASLQMRDGPLAPLAVELVTRARAEMVRGLSRGSPWNVLILPRVRLSITMVWDPAVEGTRAHRGAMVADEINFNTTDKVTSQFDFSDKTREKGTETDFSKILS